VAERLGYSADPTARGLRLRITGAVGVLYSDALPFAFSDPAFSGFLRGVAEILEAEGRTLALLSGGAPRAKGGDALRGAAVDGVIWYGPADGDPRLRELPARGLPLVLVDAEPATGLATLAVDDEAGAAAAADHLFALGHRRVAVLGIGDWTSPPARVEPASLSRSAFRVIRARARGYAAAARSHGVRFAQLTAWLVPSSFEQGRIVGLELLRGAGRPTAVLCMSDALALGVMAAAREAGLAVPGDLSVVGFDDVPGSARSVPPLTTVAQDHAGKGRAAAAALLAMLAGAGPGAPDRLPAALTVRGSTGPPAPSRA
jgi:DNA-binding LacI/PurR family transcriptional regulator